MGFQSHSRHSLLPGRLMAELALFLFVAAMLAIMISVALAADDSPSALVLGKGCSPHKYVNATAFTKNLDSVLQSLLSNLSSDGFATSNQSKYGKTDPVYGLAVCRKYLSARGCSECVQEAVRQAAMREKVKCSEPNGVRIHLDGCLLRYENNSFYDEDVDAVDSFYCASTIANDSSAFYETAQNLSTQLQTNAYENNGYAVGSIDSSLYGLAQCWPSLTNSSCLTCLTAARSKLLACPPRTEGRGLEAGCFMRYSTYPFFPHNQTNSSSTNLTMSSGKSSSQTVPILVGIFGGIALVTVLCLVYFYRCFRHRKNYDQAGADENLAARGNFEQAIFAYEILRDSTGNFHRSNMVGKGGFGEVYKGILLDGTVVAVKRRLTARHETAQAAEEFLREVKLLTSVRHRNLVRLLGCSTRGQERLLVYEFMSNNSLNKHLFGEIRNPLSWENRLNITVSTARGLAYLHEESDVRIIHRDIKCGNILLGDNFHPKIADFGLARFFPEGETHVSTRVGGTTGYTAPEYAVHGQLTVKADVYSYGVVVLEIVSGRKCVDATLPVAMHLLLEWAWNQYKLDKVLDIIDPRLEGKYPREQALRVITIALLCTQGSWALRPAMSPVGLMLTTNSEIPAQPTQPAFIDSAAGRPANFASTSESATTATDPSQGSHGSITVSLFRR